METKDYEQMVLRLQKPGEDILNTLTPAQAALLHMALGLAAEVGEWLTAGSFENLVEETGDLLFFVTAVRLYYGIEEPRIADDCNIEKHTDADCLQYARVNCLIADMVKKNIIYGRAWTAEKQQMLEDNICIWYHHTLSILATKQAVTGVTAQQMLHFLRESNAKKLMTGEKPRYAAGSYSDAAAQTRADKDGAED